MYITYFEIFTVLILGLCFGSGVTVILFSMFLMKEVKTNGK